MTIEEIFAQTSQHMIEGIMTHAQLSDYYNFIGLKGYAKCHEYHFLSENINFKNLSFYFLTHRNKLIPETQTNNPKVIPSSWFNYTRQDVDTETRKMAIQASFETWVNWEHNTKALYTNFYNELIRINEVAAAKEIEKYLIDVDYELAEAEQEQLECKAIDYDIFTLIDNQNDLVKKYNKKIKEINLC